MNDKQKRWVEFYERETGFDVLHLDRLEAGKMTFHEVAKWNIDWYESYSNDVFLRISGRILEGTGY